LNLKQAILSNFLSSWELYLPIVSIILWLAPSPRGLVFGHRAVYISFAPASQWLTPPEIYKALNPKTGICSIVSTTTIVTFLALR